MIRSNPPQLSVGICDMLDTPLIPSPRTVSCILYPHANLLWNADLGGGWGKIKGRRYPQQKVCLRVAGEAQSISPGEEALPPALPWDLQASVLKAVAKETVLKCMLLPLSSASTPKTASSHPALSSLPAQGLKSHR